MLISTRIQKSFVSVLIVLAGAGALAAPSVTELTASEIPAFIAKHPNVVMQFTSPDPKCTFCVGADTPFNAVASNSFSQPVAFARVQWPAPWRNFPVFAAPLKVSGIPEQKFFKNGKEVDAVQGINKDPAILNKAVHAFLSHKLNTEGEMVVEPSPAVLNVKADQMVAFLNKHERVVVQLISSDINCAFCNGAEVPFNEAAAKNSDKTLVFARVQWHKQWNRVPDFGALIKVTGLPTQVVFRKGQNIGSVEGGIADAQKLQQEFLVILNKPEKPIAEKVQSPSVNIGVGSVTDEEQTAIRTMVRYMTYVDTALKCMKPQRTLNNDAAKSMEELRKTHAKSIDIAEKSAGKLKTTEDMARYMKWIDEEKSAFKSWQENTLGIPASKATDSDSCAKTIKNANAYMEAKYSLN